MAHLIDKSALVAEIKHHLQFTPEHTNAFIEGEEHAYRTILSFLDTLEVKEVDINKEISQFIDAKFEKATIGHKLSLRRIAKHFFELGFKHSKENKV